MVVGGLRVWWLKPLAGILLCTSLAACAGPPKGVLVPVATGAPGAATVDMIVATTRSAGATPAEMFTGERGRDPAFARITVSIPPDSARTVGEVQWPSRVPGNPATDFVTLRADRLDRQGALDWFHKAVARTPKRRVLVFIHGFNNRFEDAVFRFAQIVHDSGSPVVPVLFTWPSRASILAYGYDRESSTYSRDALETLLTALARDPAVGEISVLAHSMGNWVTLEALRQMAIRNGRVASKIRNVMLAAPDVDVDVFRTQLAAITRPRPNVTLFVSQDDRALAVSRRVWGSSARLGAINPEAEPYHTDLPRDGITVIDLTKLQTGDRLNHGKFAQSPEVVQIIGQRLVAGQTMTDQRVGLGDRIIQLTAGAASSVGTAAGLVISAPVSVLDETSRGNYGAHVERLGGSLADTAEATGTLLVPQTSARRQGTAAERPSP
ncbi:alpha/beta hydrolase [Chelatococcus daeguensis]|uniref:alpha/beta hydrolase n=1 Tax=Chelatococcus daeguensis TaxID=444444 RepID=UPI0007AC17AE|nr:alpha/beta hydrolase [Chelatococcus daeguensis]KZE36050.1 esterase [Chelatococcus daeguensis]MBM3084195.1 alpha/beta hydrolase [Chelatococcus daeguensis]